MSTLDRESYRAREHGCGAGQGPRGRMLEADGRRFLRRGASALGFLRCGFRCARPSLQLKHWHRCERAEVETATTVDEGLLRGSEEMEVGVARREATA